MVRAVVSAVATAGGSREQFIERSGIAAEQLDGQATWVSIDDYKRIVDVALEVTGDSALGLHFAEQASSVVFQLLAHLVQHSATLGEALEMIVRYTELLAPGFKPCLAIEGEQVAIRFAWLRGEQPAVRVMAELALRGLLRLLDQYVADTADCVRAAFAYSKPVRIDEYRRVFGERARFSQPYTQLGFPREWLARGQLHANPELQLVLKLQAERQLALQRSSKLSARVEQLLAAHDPRSLPAMATIARSLRVSTRTLTRRLQSEGLTFAELIVRRRSNAARGLLGLGALSVQEVAAAMGFADAPAFHKAFKRWTGLTPLQYVATVKRDASSR